MNKYDIIIYEDADDDSEEFDKVTVHGFKAKDHMEARAYGEALAKSMLFGKPAVHVEYRKVYPPKTKN